MAVMESKVGDWAKLELRIQQNMVRAPTIVTLDVGDTIFKTSKDTLVRVKGSYFHVLLGSGLWTPDSGGDAYFLDLDPTLFRRALMFMRMGTAMSTDGLTTIERHEFYAMMEYLNLTEAPTQSLSHTLKQSHSRLTALLHAVDRPADDALGADQEEFIRLLSDEASPTSSLHHEVLQCISALFARAKRDFSRDTFHLPPGLFTFQSFSTGCSYLYTHAASVNAAPLTSPMVMEVRRIVHTLLGFQPCFRTNDGTMNLHVLVTAWKNTTKLCKTFSAHIAIPENAPAIANLVGYVQTSALDTVRFLDGCLSTALPLDSTTITHNIQVNITQLPSCGARVLFKALQGLVHTFANVMSSSEVRFFTQVPSVLLPPQPAQPLDPACRQHWTSLVDDVSNCIQASLSLGDPTTERGLKTFETGLLGSIQSTHPSDQVLHLLAAYARYCVERTPISTVVERICADGPSHAFGRVDQAKLCLLERFSRSLLDGVDAASRVVYTEKFMRMCYECCGTAVQIIEQASDDGLWRIVDATLLVLGGIFSSHAVDDSTNDHDVQACIAETMPMLLQVLDQLATLTCPPGYDMRINMYANEKCIVLAMLWKHYCKVFLALLGSSDWPVVCTTLEAISVVLSDSSLPLQANGICQDLHEAASVLSEYIDIKYNKETTAVDPAKVRKRTQSQLDRLGDACARVKRACSMHPRLLDDHKIHVALDNVTGLLDNLVQTLEMSDR
ncbi:hypothetical protein DYB37_005221 [Aphanomyces astaci]|uniref:BTB domain-containing protein n=1 Tax=Aphanomyces astaci TaxID=112090 RepID=A0A3R7A8G6_APHAT|nr:hypothetical protein DYB37_005221 [Aphanomyces astaci]